MYIKPSSVMFDHAGKFWLLIKFCCLETDEKKLRKIVFSEGKWIFFQLSGIIVTENSTNEFYQCYLIARTAKHISFENVPKLFGSFGMSFSEIFLVFFFANFEKIFMLFFKRLYLRAYKEYRWCNFFLNLGTKEKSNRQNLITTVFRNYAASMVFLTNFFEFV